MRPILTLLLIASAAAPAAAQLQPASAARQIFENDWVLMNWALKHFDRDSDILLSAGEAQLAAQEFRKIADADEDGRVSQHEFRAARDFILAR
jgi:hypothetical protein